MSVVVEKKILFLCQVFYPDMQSTSQLFTDLFSRISHEKFRVSVVCGYPALFDSNGREEVENRQELENISIYRTGMRSNFKKSMLLRLCHYAAYCIGASWSVYRLRKCDFVLGVTNPPFTPVWLWLLSCIFRFRYQLALGDIFPDGLVAINSLDKHSVINRLWTYFNRIAFNKAEKIVVLGRDMSRLIQEKYGVEKSRIYYIPHWSSFQPEIPVEAESTTLWKVLDFKDEFVVQYSGNMGLWHDIETLVKTAAKLRNHSRIKFLFIGDGRRKEQAFRYSVDLGLENIIWLPFQPKEDLSDSLSCCHLSIISQRAGLEGVAVPCKLYGILASGRGILGMVPSQSEVGMVLSEEQCGECIEPSDSEELAATILRLAKQRGLVNEMGRRGYRAYLNKYTLDQAVGSFLNMWY